jgi:hypothetical protein
MTDWAEAAAKKALEQKLVRDQNIEKSNREAKIKAEAGPRLFKQLIDWINQEVTKYNKLLLSGSDGSEELFVKVTQSVKPSPELLYDHIVVGREDGKKGPLKIEYLTASGVLHYECGGGKGAFTLHVSDDGQASFRTPYHQVKTIEEIGAEMLSKFLEAKF